MNNFITFYVGTGTKEKTHDTWRRVLPQITKARIVEMTESDLAAGASCGSCLIVPGGRARQIADAIGVEGRQAIRQYVGGGGGYLGVCAGAYLGSAHYDWSLNMVNARMCDTQHWRRGRGMVACKLTQKGRTFFGDSQATSFDVRYANGPLIEQDNKILRFPRYIELARYVDDMHQRGAPEGVMPGKTAILRSHFGAGRVVLCGPHPESSKELWPMIERMLDWLITGSMP